MPTPKKPASVPTVRTDVDPATEYVSGGGLAWLASYLAALPHSVDDVTRDFGDDLYDRMLHDPTVAACFNTLKHGILANRIALPAVKLPVTQENVTDAGEQAALGLTKDVPHVDQSKADEIAAFCERMLSSLDTPLTDVLWNLLDALAFGNKVAEKVYADGTGEDAGRLVLKKLKVKPRRTTAFVVDAFGNTIGLLAIIPGVSFTAMTQGIFTDQSLLGNFLPREKFAILTCRERDADPRGTSLARPAYYSWFAKTQVWPAYLKFLGLYAVGILVGTTGEQSFAETPAYQPDGVTPMTDGTGAQVYLTPQQALLQNLLALSGGTAIALPYGTTLDTLKPAGDGSVFGAANDLFNREIEKAITGQTLATSEAQHDTRAASQTHQDVLGGLVSYGRGLVETMLYRDVLCPAVEINFGPDALPLTPRPVLSDVEQQDAASMWAAVASLQTSGYLDPSQKIALDAQVGLPDRSAESVAQDAARPALPVPTAGDENASGEQQSNEQKD